MFGGRLLSPHRRLSVHPILHPIGGSGSVPQACIMQCTHLCAEDVSPVPCLVPGSTISVIQMTETSPVDKAHLHLVPFEPPVDPQLMVHLLGEQHPSSASPPPFPHVALERLMIRVCAVNEWVAAGLMMSLISPFSSLMSIAQSESERGNPSVSVSNSSYLLLF